MQPLQSHLHQFDLHNKTVLLRIDANVAINNGIIIDDFKLEKTKKTIDFILKNNATCIILTHLGNPKEISGQLSTKQLLPWFEQQSYSITFAETLEEITSIPKTPGTIILFENLRFFKEEKGLDTHFAQQLALLGNFYVNDSFGTIHRNETSTTLLPFEFAQEKRTIGFLMEEELALYEKMLHIKPSLMIVGGAKPETKIPLIKKCASYIDTILLCPLLSNVTTDIPNNVIIPIDYVIETKMGILSEISADNLKSTDICISIGSKTITFYSKYISHAQLIVWNGFMGFLERPNTLHSSQKIARLITHSNAYTIVAGADTSSFIRKYTPYQPLISTFSTGGGATLALIAREELPGLIPFLK